MSKTNSKILLTGGSGRLGTALRGLIPSLIAPPSSELDITDRSKVRSVLDQYQPQVIVHAAAYTDVAGAERQREACWRVNVEGTRNIVEGARAIDARLVHISTDYVFWGDQGGYTETDTPGPVRNHYALTKLLAEEAVRSWPRHLIIRTSFRPSPWPYPVAFDDLYTSQDYVELIAPEIALALRHLDQIPHSVLHIATERKSVYDLAQRTRPEVQRGSRSTAAVALPEDISLNVGLWNELKKSWL
jgi:dTDP-4-dehydrorhamnose reductase